LTPFRILPTNSAEVGKMNTDSPAVKKSISIPAWLLEIARERSKQEQRSLSSYIQFLIARDAEKARESQDFSTPA
jgi:hypothetical protein